MKQTVGEPGEGIQWYSASTIAIAAYCLQQLFPKAFPTFRYLLNIMTIKVDGYFRIGHMRQLSISMDLPCIPCYTI